MSQEITIAPSVLEQCPSLRLHCLTSKVIVKESSPSFWEDIEPRFPNFSDASAIREQAVIQETRIAYKALGKDPSRYRPSAEALSRRWASGKGLYQISNVVDIVNAVALISGFSIGAFDCTKIAGPITARIGTIEEYETIGRGSLNVEGLLVLADSKSAFGNPSSDSARTCISELTTEILVVCYDFASNSSLTDAITLMKQLLERYGR